MRPGHWASIVQRRNSKLPSRPLGLYRPTTKQQAGQEWREPESRRAMSEDLLLKMLSHIEQEDGISEAKKKAKKEKRAARSGEAAQRIQAAKLELRAAAKGAIKLSEEEQYLVKAAVSDAAQQRGVSLLDEARKRRATDFTDRNLKYIRYAGKLTLNEKQALDLVRHHSRSLPSTQEVREDRQKIDGMREPKRDRKGKMKKKNQKDKSIFSQADFDRVKKREKKPFQNSDGVFL